MPPLVSVFSGNSRVAIMIPRPTDAVALLVDTYVEIGHVLAESEIASRK